MSFFDQAYEGVPPWDIGRPQPAIERLAPALRGPLLDAGCGTGENALLLAARGLDVTGIDSSPRAIEKARRKARERGLAARFLVADALDLRDVGGPFATVIDTGLMHVFDPDGRRAYARSLAGVTRPGADVHVLAFSDREPGEEGPYRLRRDDFARAFAEGWRVVGVEPATFESLWGAAQAWLAHIQRS